MLLFIFFLQYISTTFTIKLNIQINHYTKKKIIGKSHTHLGRFRTHNLTLTLLLQREVVPFELELIGHSTQKLVQLWKADFSFTSA